MEETGVENITPATMVVFPEDGGNGSESGDNGSGESMESETSFKRCQSAVRGLSISAHNVGVDVVKGGGWRNIFRPKGSKKETKKKILQNVTAVIRSGEMYGLMGPSGAGKTTLLDVISHRLKQPAKRHGEVLYDSHIPTMSEVRKDASYVEQSDDVLSCMGHFTVFEIVLFAAMCKLPHDKWTKQEKIERVHQVLKQISLDQAKGTVVGNPGVGLRGVSGGERKRVAISMGLLYNPRAIFLDEPTTGLDSAMASEVMHIVKSRLQGRGCTLVVTIHQPSPVIYNLLDQLILLKAGKVVYMGPGGMEPCHHMKGLGFPYRQGYNVAEFLLETITDKSATCDFAKEFAQSPHAVVEAKTAASVWETHLREGKGKATHDSDSTKGAGEDRMCYANSHLREIWILLKYRVGPKLRMTWFVSSKLALPILVGAVYATFFANLSQDFFGAFATAGVLFVTVALAGFLAIAPLEDFKGEWALILRQRQDGYYRSGSYVIEKMCQEIPYGVLGSIGFALITYFAIGLKMTPYAFFFYTLCSFTVNMISTAISFGVASNIHVEFLPQVIIHVWTTLNIMVTGLFLPACQIPKWWKWLYYISYQQWTWAALMLNQYGQQSGVDKTKEACETTMGTEGQCSGALGSLMNALPTLIQATDPNFSPNSNLSKCEAMDKFALSMFFLGEGSHSNQWMCLLWAALSLPVFLALFYVGIWRSTRRKM